MHTIEFSQFTILPNHAILNSDRSVDCIVKGITAHIALTPVPNLYIRGIIIIYLRV